MVRPLLGHKDRKTTDRYVTYNRMSYSSVLDAIPRINRGVKKEVTEQIEPKHLDGKNGKNWQGGGEEHILFLTSKATSN